MCLAVLACAWAVDVALADDAWESRIEQRTAALEKRLHELDGASASEGGLVERMRSLEGRIAALESRAGIEARSESYYEGDDRDKQLASLSKAVVSLESRLREVTSTREEDEPAGGAPPPEAETPSAGAVGAADEAPTWKAAQTLVWGRDDELDDLARLLKAWSPQQALEFVAAIRKSLRQAPPEAYLEDERVRQEVEAWSKRLKHTDRKARAQAALELGYSQHPTALAPLLAAARSAADTIDRNWAIHGLELLGRVDAIPPLIDMIVDPEPAAAEFAIDRIIAGIEGEMHAFSVKGYLSLSGPRLQEYWRRYYASHEEDLRRRSHQPRESPKAPEPQPSAEAMDLVSRLLYSSEEEHLGSELQALDVPTLTRILRASRSAVQALRLERTAPSAAPWNRPEAEWERIWIQRAHDLRGVLAEYAMPELGKFETPACIETLLWALASHPSRWARCSAAASIQQTDRLELAPALIGALTDDDPFVRNTIRSCLEELTGYSPQGKAHLKPPTRAEAVVLQRLYRQWLATHRGRAPGKR